MEKAIKKIYIFFPILSLNDMDKPINRKIQINVNRVGTGSVMLKKSMFLSKNLVNKSITKNGNPIYIKCLNFFKNFNIFL